MSFIQRARDPVGWLINSVKDYGLEYIFKRYYGVYRGVVVANDDPENRLRVRVQIPAIGHYSQSDMRETIWALPCMNGLSVGEKGAQVHGLFWPPNVNDQVWVMFENGKTQFPIYLGGWVPRNEPSGKTLIPETGKDGSLKGMKTASGHYIKFRSDGDDLGITIAKGDGVGVESGTYIEMDKDENIIVQNQHGGTIFMDKDKVLVAAPDGAYVSAGDGKAIMSDSKGSFFSIDGGNAVAGCKNFTVKASGKITLKGNCDLGPGPIYESALLGDSFTVLYLTHVHTVTLPTLPNSPQVGPPPIKGNGKSKAVRVS